ncbi:putative sulfate transporter [Podospora didyma]|uniref:Sulfate transporter n=1 Tax=Podospora didyma TaxID=330526 RepID=A0AAE0K5Y6_9PEZI|nr:putative sulfate transporter [Podospora didyma]
MAFSGIARVNRQNWDTIRRSPTSEISGALGDLGTLLPLMIALALQGSIDLPSTLVLTGVFNIATGVIFGIPLPVQPMKAIAAAAISSRSSLHDTVAAGALVSGAVLFLSITGLLRLLTRYIPLAVVKGIQAGAGLSLVISAGTSLLSPLSWVLPPLNSRLCAFVAFAVLLLTQRLSPRFPFALLIFLLGIFSAALFPTYHALNLQLWHPSLLLPSFLSTPAISMALAQLPLTTLNSIIAASALSRSLFPTHDLVSVTSLGLSVAAMNLVGCWTGAMPVCHGAGGLAAQHRFGARSGASVILLGAFKALVGLFFASGGNNSLLGLLARFPRSLLGVMVAAAGLELARAGASLNDDDAESPADDDSGAVVMLAAKRPQERLNVMLTTAAGILAFKNDAVGFALGMLCHGAYKLADYVERKQAARGHLLRCDEGRPLLS